MTVVAYSTTARRLTTTGTHCSYDKNVVACLSNHVRYDPASRRLINAVYSTSVCSNCMNYTTYSRTARRLVNNSGLHCSEIA